MTYLDYVLNEKIPDRKGEKKINEKIHVYVVNI